MRTIDADALKKKICREYHPMDEIPFFEIMHIISNAPTIEERRTGHWIKNAPPWDCQNPPFICSECGNPRLLFETPYCEICGADMRSAQNLSYADNDTAQGGLASAT